MRNELYMQRALELAARGQGRVEPNPMVGAVLVHDAAKGDDRQTPAVPGGRRGHETSGEIIGEGWHGRFGGPHAEVEAITDCRRRGLAPAGGTMFVNLEPCCHHGKTPPCIDTLIDANVARVVVAMIDPSEKAAGQGIARLREAGVEVEVGLCEQAARELNAPFIKRERTGLPWVIGKWAQTLDGKIATASGDSRWISSDGSRRRVHQLRARVDAVVVGIGTALADRPRLTAREVELKRVARRVVVDPMLRLNLNESPWLGGEGREPDRREGNTKSDLTDPGTTAAHHHPPTDPPPVTIVTEQGAFERNRELVLACRERGIELLPLSERCGGRLDLRPLLEHLVRHHQATNVLVEGGAGLLGSFLEQGQLDQVLAFIAPKLMGDVEALSAVRGLPCERISDAIDLDLRGVERIDDDVLLDYRC